MSKQERKQANRDLAAWCRSVGVSPTGQAWAALQAGDRDPVRLAGLNLADGTPAKRLDDGTQLPGALRHGDYIPAHEARVTCAPVLDPETGRVWVTLSDGQDVAYGVLEPVTYVRKREAPAWVREVHETYLAARVQWELDREADSNGWATEMREFAQAHPAPRYADHVRAYWDARREVA